MTLLAQMYFSNLSSAALSFSAHADIMFVIAFFNILSLFDFLLSL